jgi:hypothetical protein
LDGLPKLLGHGLVPRREKLERYGWIGHLLT